MNKMTNVDGSTFGQRRRPKLKIELELEELPVVSIHADSYEDEQRLRLWAAGAPMALLLHGVLESLDDRLAA